MNAIVISLGGLNVSQVGCYGCEWIDTPHCNRFATEGFVFDQCLVDCPTPESARWAWWTGRRQWQEMSTRESSPAPAEARLIRLLRASGVHTVLIRDTSGLLGASNDEEPQFDEVIDLERDPDSGAARVFEAASEWLKRSAGRGRFLLFLDCHGAHPPWPTSDAADGAEEDAEIDAETHDELGAVGSTSTDESAEESEVDPVRSNFAARVSTLDAEFGEFVDFVRGHVAGNELLVIVTSDVGVNLADVAAPPRLGEAWVHVPLLVQLPERFAATGRSHALVQGIDLLPTVLDAMQLELPAGLDGCSMLPIIQSEKRSIRDFVEMRVGGESSLRTAAWYLVQSRDPASGESNFVLRLYEKPADRWETNDVSKSHSDQVESLLARRNSPI